MEFHASWLLLLAVAAVIGYGATQIAQAAEKQHAKDAATTAALSAPSD